MLSKTCSLYSRLAGWMISYLGMCFCQSVVSTPTPEGSHHQGHYAYHHKNGDDRHSVSCYLSYIRWLCAAASWHTSTCYLSTSNHMKILMIFLPRNSGRAYCWGRHSKHLYLHFFQGSALRAGGCNLHQVRANLIKKQGLLVTWAASPKNTAEHFNHPWTY